MKLTLIQPQALNSVWLPEKANGQYFVEFTNERAKSERLLSVVPEGERWRIDCGKNAYIHTKSQNSVLLSYVIDGNLPSIPIFIRSTMENAVLLFEDDSPAACVFKKYFLNGRITIGAGASNHLTLNSFLVPDVCAEISADEKRMVYKELDPRAHTFINGERTAEKELCAGDAIFICGYTIIVGKNLLAINKTTALTARSDGSFYEYAAEKRDTSKLKEYFDDVRSESFFYVAPRFLKAEKKEIIELAQPPHKGGGSSQPAVLSMGPAFTMGIASAATAAFTVTNTINNGGELISVMPTLIMSGSMVMSSLFWPVLSRSYSSLKEKRDEKKRKRLYIGYLERIAEQTDEIMVRQREALIEHYPEADRLAVRAEICSGNLWERRQNDADFLCVSLGRGSVPAMLEIKVKEKELKLNQDILENEMYKAASRKAELTDAPVVLSFKENYAVGIVGNRRRVIELAKGLITQLAVLHSYSELKIAVLFEQSERAQWESLRWLPHCWSDDKSVRFIASDTDELKTVSAALEAELNGERTAHYVIFAASSLLASKTNLIEHILQKKEYCGFSVVTLYDEAGRLPKECSMVLRFCSDKEAEDNSDSVENCLVVKGRDCPEQFYIRPYSVSAALLDKIAVDLANVKLGVIEGGYEMPEQLSFCSMMGVSRVEELNCLQRWRESDTVHTLAAPVGVDSRGDLFSINLHQKAHGPHGLIAGTTGSGKSEFIMTMILSLAVNYSPLEVSFLLIDYKGGGMAAAFKGLPHIAGIITNLDGAAVSRSLISLESELKRRQALFLETGEKLGTTVSDIYYYQQLYRDGRVEKPLQHLFIISDEFAELKDQCPEFMDELISAARIGRSLGVHLILATQKPSGVVNDQIWSNSRFKICLKVQDRADSMDVIRCPDAAALTQTGRFYMQVGYNEIFELGQSAWCGAGYEPETENGGKKDSGITIVNGAGQVIGSATYGALQGRKTARPAVKQLQAVTDYITQLCVKENMASDRLWLEPVPEVIYTAQLAERYAYRTDAEKVTAVIGEYDIPQKQEQKLMCVSAQDGNIIIYGSPESGKTTFLIGFIFDILCRYTPENAVFYIIDMGLETLKAFEGYNGVGAVMTAANADKIENLFRWLSSELERRCEKLSANGGDYMRYRSCHSDMPAVHVVIANYGAFCESFEQYGDLIEIMTRDGVKMGIYFVLTSLTTTGIRYRLLQNFSNLFTLNLTDESYSSVFGGIRKKAPAKYKGRGLFKKDEVYEFQTAYITDREDVFAFIREKADAVNSRSSAKAHEILVLPKTFEPEKAVELTTNPLMPVIALARSTVVPVSLDISNRVNIISGSSEVNPSIAAGAAAVLSSFHRTIILECDYSLAGTAKCEHCSKEELEKKLVELHGIARERFDSALAQEKRDGTLPDYSAQLIVCVVYGVNEVLSSLSSDARDKLEHLLLGGRLDFGIRFVLFESSDKLRLFSRCQWFLKNVRLGSYFWAGSGLGIDTLFRHRNFSDSRFDFGEDLGYAVSDGQREIIKLVSVGEGR